MNKGFKNTPKQVLILPKENNPNKDFTLFHIKFDPLILPDYQKYPLFLKIKRFQTPKCETCVTRSTAKKTPFQAFFVHACVH